MKWFKHHERTEKIPTFAPSLASQLSTNGVDNATEICLLIDRRDLLKGATGRVVDELMCLGDNLESSVQYMHKTSFHLNIRD